jgi:hypothetical protein
MPSFRHKGKKGQPELEPEPEPRSAPLQSSGAREQAPRETTMAVWDNDVAAVRAHVTGHRTANAFEDPDDGTSLLLLACLNKYEEVALHLISMGADVNACSDSDRTSPLVHATKGGCIDTAEALLDRGADPEHTCSNGLTALAVATQSGDGDLMQVLLGAGASPDGGQPSALALATASYDEAVASNDEAADGACIPTVTRNTGSPCLTTVLPLPRWLLPWRSVAGAAGNARRACCTCRVTRCRRWCAGPGGRGDAV